MACDESPISAECIRHVINLDACTGVKGVFMSLTYAAQQSEGSARKSGAIAAVVLLHLGFLYAFTHGLNVVVFTQPLQDITAILIPEEKPPQETPPVVEPKPLETPIEQMVAEAPIPVPVDVPPDMPMEVPTGDTAISPPVNAIPPAHAFSIKHRVDPQYPAAARRAGESGTVLLSIVIGPDGVPTEIDVERSSGYAALDQAATAAVRQWRFTVSSDSSYSRVRLPITFRLETGR